MTRRRPLVYIAGPYSADPVTHTRAAINAGLSLLDTGLITPLIPHLTLVADLVRPRPYRYWCDLDLAHVEHCDALLRIEGDSAGADHEVSTAHQLGIPVFTNASALLAWATRRHTLTVPTGGPVDQFRDLHPDPTLGPDDYVQYARGTLEQLDWLTWAGIPPAVRLDTVPALYGADGQGLDRATHWPFVLLWCLRLNDCLVPVDGLDHQLHDWCTSVEDHTRERLHWLPSFPAHPKGN